MGLTANVLASGSGWRVQDVVCTFGPHDRPFAERHHGVCVAAVTEGTFQYRSTLGSAVLAPGALLLGNDHHAFECRHEHGTGDRCLSFRLTPEFLEGRGASAADGRQHFGDRVCSGLQRSVDVQSSLSAHHGAQSERLSRFIAPVTGKQRGTRQTQRQFVHCILR
jgi:hypothetical protein